MAANLQPQTNLGVTSNTQLNYWDHVSLKLYYNSGSDCSIDDIGAKKYNKTANVTSDLVTQVQKELIYLGYLTDIADGYYGSKTKRSVLRFQRHAKRLYRMLGCGTPDDVKTPTYTGQVNGVCDHATAKE